MNEERVLRERLMQLTFRENDLTPDDISEIIGILDRLDEIDPIRDIPDAELAYEDLKKITKNR